MNAVTRSPSESVNRNWARGLGAFLAQDQPGPGGPGAHLDQPGGFGDPPAVAEVAVGVDCRIPAVVGVEDFHRVAHPGVDGVAEGESHPGLPARGGERVGPTRRIGAHQNLLRARIVRVRPVSHRQRFQSLLQHGDVVGGGITPRVAGSQQPGHCFAAGDLGTVQKHQQRVMTPVFFQVAAASCLLSEWSMVMVASTSRCNHAPGSGATPAAHAAARA
jgi:hypothetical protein